MKRLSAKMVRALLRQYGEGLTVAQIAEMLNVREDSVKHSLMKMPDVYIDRWMKINPGANGRAGSHYPVYCAVHVPENCPRPRPDPKPSNVKLRLIRQEKREESMRSPHVTQRFA